MNLLEISVLCIVIFICLFAIVDRICKCVEQCNLGKNYTDFLKTSKKDTTDVEDTNKTLPKAR